MYFSVIVAHLTFRYFLFIAFSKTWFTDIFRKGQMTNSVGSIYNDMKKDVFIPGVLKKRVTSIVALLFPGSNWTVKILCVS